VTLPRRAAERFLAVTTHSARALQADEHILRLVSGLEVVQRLHPIAA
jgi:hypothetical protein